MMSQLIRKLRFSTPLLVEESFIKNGIVLTRTKQLFQLFQTITAFLVDAE